ncbi:hypothetical protein COLO4_24449 [Corchorus olitorius]|uniref:Uncharacterized protein n=1 Tax=Corchorus olitorius TaxID=93759 RepID=A0A1R3IA23_9ROSI|nr:hypothetical protein COLO4_24449 [Corchorus olitorius]
MSPFRSSPMEDDLSLDIRSDCGLVNPVEFDEKGVTKLILGDAAQVDLDSDISLSDVDIRSRNDLILKEAEATFELLELPGMIESCNGF